MGGHLKRRRPDSAWRPEQMLNQLLQLQLHAVLQRNCIWLSVEPQLAECLNLCCTGQVDGGPGTADDVAAMLRQAFHLLQQQQQPHSGPQDSASARVPESTAPSVHVTPPSAEVPVQDVAMAALEPSPAHLSSVPDGSAGEGGSTLPSGSELAAGRQVNSAGGTANPITQSHGQGGGRGSGGGVQGRGGRGGGRGPRGGGWLSGRQDELVGVRLTLEEAFFLHYVLGCLTVWMPVEDGQQQGVERKPATVTSQAVAACTERSESAACSQEQAAADTSATAMPAAPAPAAGVGDGEQVVLGGGAAAADGVQVPVVQPLDTQALWSACCRVRSNFVTSYVAYHHLKSKGWLPRSGLLYGADFVVYQMHPAVMHSEFGVMVVPMTGPHNPDMQWHDVQITNRLINQVSKKLIMLYVFEQAHHSHDTPECLLNFSVEERLIVRWVPAATRD